MAFYKKAKKFVRKAGRRVGAAAKKRYGGKTGVKNVVKDVMMIKRLINVEKKRIHLTLGVQAVGQVIAASNGSQAYDVTPIATEALTYQGRTGSSIKIVSAYMKFQFWQQAGNTHATKFRIELWRVKGALQTPSTLFTQLYLPNPNTSVAVYDYNSMRNPDYFGDAKMVCRRSYSNVPQFSGENKITDVTIPLKFNHHVRYDKDSNTVTDGQLLLFVIADCGNASAGTASVISGIPITAANTGMLYNQDICWYYVDN